jgi:hypothetical protein
MVGVVARGGCGGGWVVGFINQILLLLLLVLGMKV